MHFTIKQVIVVTEIEYEPLLASKQIFRQQYMHINDNFATVFDW